MNSDCSAPDASLPQEGRRLHVPAKTGHRRPPSTSLFQAHIGRQLKKYYSSILTEPMPTRFEQLLDELEQKERALKAGKDTESSSP